MGLLDQIFKPKSERAYQRAMKDGKFQEAIEVATQHSMDAGRVADAAKAWLEQEWDKGQFEKAAEIGTQYRLSKKKTHDAADRALDASLKTKNIEKAIALIERFELDRRKLLVEADRIYQHEMEAEAFNKAADIARRAGLDQERIEKAVSRAFKKAMREKDEATLADFGLHYADLDLDWVRVEQARINLVVAHLVGQVYDQAMAVVARYHMPEEEVGRALEQAAESRHNYLHKLRSSIMVKEGGQRAVIPAPDDLFREIETGFRKEWEKRQTSS